MYCNFEKLMQNAHTNAAVVGRELGIAHSTLSDWKSGRSTPKADKLQKIADYFGVSVSYLINGEEEAPKNYYINEETRDMAQRIFDSEELRGLFDAAKDASPEDLETVHTMLLALKRKEKKEGE